MSEELNKNDSWGEYGTHILKELVRLNSGIDEVRKEQSEMKQDLVQIRHQQKTLESLTEWREKVIEVMSVTQMKEVKDEVYKLKDFKTQAITIWATVQIIFAIVLTVIEIIKH